MTHENKDDEVSFFGEGYEISSLVAGGQEVMNEREQKSRTNFRKRAPNKVLPD